MTEAEYVKAMKKIEKENYDTTLEACDLENQLDNIRIRQRNLQKKKMKLERTFVLERESEPDLTLVRS